MHIVYKTTNLIDSKIYVGVHLTNSLEFDGYFGSGKYLLRAIKKYGKENFKRETLFECNSKEEAYDLESMIVCEKFISRPDVYNMKIGGFGGSDKGRKFRNPQLMSNRLSIAAKSYIKRLEETGLDHHNKGRPASDETRSKMSKSQTGKRTGELNPMYGISYEDHPKGFLGKEHTEETKSSISESLKEWYKNNPSYERTDEIKKKISDSKKGQPGHKFTEEQKQKLRKPRSKVICPHCEKEGGSNLMKRYHFDNCKDK